MINQPNNQCCKDWIEVNEFQAKQIAELEEENQLLKRVEQIFSDAPDLEFSKFEEMFPDEFEVHNLEQQISALTFALENITKPEDIYCRRKELRKQAAKLKGGE